MSTTMNDARWIDNAQNLNMEACDNIREADHCRVCPIKFTCLYEHTYAEVLDSVTVHMINDFLQLSDDLIDYVSPSDAEALNADQERKTEAEERMLWTE